MGRRAARGARRPVDGAARHHRGAALPDVARKWGARAAKLAAHPLDEAERRRRLEACAISLERVVAAPPLATVSQRFVADAVAARLASQSETSYDAWPTPWLARAARELLGGTLNDDGSVTPPPPYLAKRMGRLLARPSPRGRSTRCSRSSRGPTSCPRARTPTRGPWSGASPRRWRRGRLILKSATPRKERRAAVGYDVAARGAIQDGDATASSHATIARAALARLSDDEATWPALRASIALGAGEAEVAATLAKLAAVSRAAHPRLCACLKTDAILRWLAGLAAFATKSKRSAYATDARNALKALVEDDGAAFVRAFLDGGKGAFASAETAACASTRIQRRTIVSRAL